MARPGQNVYIERMNLTCRLDILDLNVFEDLEQVSLLSEKGKVIYNRVIPNDSLGIRLCRHCSVGWEQGKTPGSQNPGRVSQDSQTE